MKTYWSEQGSQTLSQRRSSVCQLSQGWKLKTLPFSFQPWDKGSPEVFPSESGQRKKVEVGLSSSGITIINSDWPRNNNITGHNAAGKKKKKSMELGTVHQMTLCKGRCSGTWRLSRQAFWEHALCSNHSGERWLVCQCLYIILHPFPLQPYFPRLASYHPIWVFLFYPYAWRSLPLSTHHYTPPPSFRRASRVWKDVDESEWGLRERKHYVVWSVQLLELAFMISTHVYKFLRFVYALHQCTACVCKLLVWSGLLACVVLLCGGVGWR